MKQSLRRAMRVKNLSVDSLARENYAKDIFLAIEKSDAFALSATVALYCALPDELPTQWIIERWGRDRRILLPRVGEDCQMEFYEYDPSQMSSGAYGISEPQSQSAVPHSAIDLIIVPGVAFTLRGERLGRGKGYYDRYLSREGVRACKIGVCYPHQVVDCLSVEPHDVLVDRVVS